MNAESAMSHQGARSTFGNRSSNIRPYDDLMMIGAKSPGDGFQHRAIHYKNCLHPSKPIHRSLTGWSVTFGHRRDHRA